MRSLSVLTTFSLLAAFTPAQSAIPLSRSVQRDVQCFVLYAIAVDMAVTTKDEKTQTAGSLGVMYFVGKLAVEAPGLNLAEVVRQEVAALSANPHAKEIGAACDVEFAKRGQELRDIGQQLQVPPVQSS